MSVLCAAGGRCAGPCDGVRERRRAGRSSSTTGATARSATSTRSAATGRPSRTCPKTFASTRAQATTSIERSPDASCHVACPARAPRAVPHRPLPLQCRLTVAPAHAVRALRLACRPAHPGRRRPASTSIGNGEAPHVSARRPTDDTAQVRNAGRRGRGGRWFRYSNGRGRIRREVRDPRRRLAAERSWLALGAYCRARPHRRGHRPLHAALGSDRRRGSRASPRTTETAPIAGATLTVS